ncbi:hypothetical protein B0H19DRAFT_1181714 [Mycena capillaripes]|nr:hypothetical protein B0H19DRAFT_1181714 [Mycena capillaripes]
MFSHTANIVASLSSFSHILGPKTYTMTAPSRAVASSYVVARIIIPPPQSGDSRTAWSLIPPYGDDLTLSSITSSQLVTASNNVGALLRQKPQLLISRCQHSRRLKMYTSNLRARLQDLSRILFAIDGRHPSMSQDFKTQDPMSFAAAGPAIALRYQTPSRRGSPALLFFSHPALACTATRVSRAALILTTIYLSARLQAL